MDGSLTVNTKFLLAHPSTEDHLESHSNNLNIEDNGQPPLLIQRAAFSTDDHKKNQFHTPKQALEQDINAQDQFTLASSLER